MEGPEQLGQDKYIGSFLTRFFANPQAGGTIDNSGGITARWYKVFIYLSQESEKGIDAGPGKFQVGRVRERFQGFPGERVGALRPQISVGGPVGRYEYVSPCWA